MSSMNEPRRRRLDERVQPGWSRLSETLFRYGSFVVGLLLIWLGFLTGGFFLILTGVLAAIVIIGGLFLAQIVARESWVTRPHAMPLTAAMLVGFPVAVIVFAQLAGPFLTPPPNLDQEFTGQLTPGREVVHNVSVDPRVTGMEFSIEIEASDGVPVRWFVQDPSGQSQWSGRTDQLGNSATKQLPPDPGQWTLHLIDDTGNATYAAAWRGWTTDSPPPSP